MRKKFGISISILILCFVGYIIFEQIIGGQKGMDEKYLLPSGFKGCVTIEYDVKDAAPLTIKDNEIIYKVPKNGIIQTSSPSTLGWTNEKTSGSYKINAFYVDEKGKTIEKLPQEKVRFGGNRTIEEDGKPKVEIFYQIFGTKEDEEKACSNIK